MKKYFVKTPNIVKLFFNKWVWSISKKKGQTIYLTFDDGPTEGITNWVLNELDKYNAKATFFCIGKNVKEHPNIFKNIIDKGHSIGNHTNNHLKSSSTPDVEFLKNVDLAETQINQSKHQNSKLFRPPYGKLKLSVSKKLRKKGYKIIMWDVLSADFDTEISNEKCLHNVIENTTNGSIIVFHDSIKAANKVKFVLPQILEYYTAQGYKFNALD
ncbi:Peptidoglycan/xylan/chitin deacetylase, PgdA/CDA1 family [Lutibacter oricola]|uniref:Peptidoglycan/xylan/chitin deacetylase, PgdA/CDA1 family n=1 Tax=Lutibacter oricola TaxID=762486 RepID=A0A1H3DZ81_9FLAO|nr:polysaccharide deacetylase family protein [Lutibacter oricola]SDX71660.1 Peptidoglycan/xylan/chitin deacetylase, PgdA/CDA1 family [Lutibacter oricola]